MKSLWPLLILTIFVSCKKNKIKANDADIVEVDLTDILTTDDYFKKKTASTKGADSLRIRIVELNDINHDGIKDTASIEYNEINSKYKISFSCFDRSIFLENIAGLQVKDVSDLNDDGFNEILLFLQSEESCWDEIRLYSWINEWVEKYEGLTYQCSEDNQNNYHFRKINSHTVQLSTYGINKDSIDVELGDTLENIIPNALNTHTINW